MNDIELLNVITGCRRGSVIAPAGCGKTEQVARSVLHSKGQRLVLTHTLAGVDALRSRLRKAGAHQKQYQISTIAAWSLRIGNAFPLRSGLSLTMPKDNEWNIVYEATVKLIESGCIDGIIKASYSGVFVDEYQDCARIQHNLICALANLIPCCVFGDPLQSIFGFRGNPLPDWEREVLHIFPKIAELNRPWRWEQVGNMELGNWLLQCREELCIKGQIDLRKSPATVHHRKLEGISDTQRSHEKTKFVMRALAERKGARCIVIGNSQIEGARALLARNVKATTIEPVTCKTLKTFVDKLEGREGSARLEHILDFLKEIMTEAGAASLKKVVKAFCEGKRRKSLNSIETACVNILGSQDLRPILHIFEEIPKQSKGWIFRRELLSALCASLRGVIAGTHVTLADAVWDTQNIRRHSGRCFANRSIGSTLLVKGLEFDHVIIADLESLKRNDLYVALTRGTHSITVISKSYILRP